MDNAYLDSYGGLLLMFILACGLAGVLVLASTLVGKHTHSRAKDQPYECGMAPIGDARQPFSVHFYLVALVFILFDIEAIFLYPWAVVYRELKLFAFFEMLLFIVLILAGFFYIWKKGALDWSKEDPERTGPDGGQHE